MALGNPEVPGSNPAGGEIKLIFFFIFQIHYFCNGYTFFTLFPQIGNFHKSKIEYLEGLFTDSVHCANLS